MPRPERVIHPSTGTVGEFAGSLRELRRAGGNPSYRALAASAGYSVTTLSDAAGGRQFPGLDVVLAYVQGCGGDRDEWERRWRAAAEALAAALSTDDEQPPYPGLARFERADAARFFGRDRLVAELTDRLGRDRLLAVFGASGSGKSSLLRAGLVPAVEAAGTVIEVLIVTPGRHPMRDCGPGVRACGGLIVVDQFEELFTMCDDVDERRAFVDLLVSAATDAGSTARVVLGVRADFFAACAQLATLAPVLRGATVLIGPMTDDELQAAVTGPATVAGLSVERALVTQLAADLRGQPGALPMLSHALLETWRQRRSTTLTVAGYLATGGINAAVARTAERVFAGLSAGAQAATRQVMTRLIALGDGTDDTRRRVRRVDLDLPDAEAIIDRFVAARLLVVHEDSVEIAHEALIGSWPRLRGWLTDDRELLRAHRQLADAAQTWAEHGEDGGALLRGTRLAVTRERLRDVDAAAVLRPVERRFLEASNHGERMEQAATRRRAAQLRRLTAAMAAMLVLAASAAAVAGWQWRSAAREAHDSKSRQLAAQALTVAPNDTAEAMRLSLAGFDQSPTVAARSSLLSVAGWHTFTSKLQAGAPVKDVAFSPDGSVIVSGDQSGGLTVWDARTHAVRAVLTCGSGSPARGIAINVAGLLAVGGADGSVQLWDIASRARVARLAAPPGHAGRVAGVTFSPDGTMLAAAFEQGPLRLWRVADGAVVASVPDQGNPRAKVAFSADGRRLVFIDGAGLTVWDLAAGRPVARLATTPTVPDALAVSRDGRHIAVGSRDVPDITVWDPDTGTTHQLRGHTNYVSSLAFSPDGRTLVSGGYDLSAIVWDVARSRPVNMLAGHVSEIYAVAFSPDGRTVAAASRDRTVLTWERADMPLTGHTDNVTSVAVSPDRRLVASAAGTAVLLWDAGTRTAVATLTGHRDRVGSVAFSPDGTLLASASDDHTVRIWDTSTGRLVRELDAATDQLYTVAFSPDGRTVAAGGADGHLYRWRTATWQPQDTPLYFPYQGTSPARITDVAFDPAGRWVAVAEADGLVSLVTPDGGVQRRLTRRGVLNAIAVAPDGARIAVGTPDGSVMLVDVAHDAATTLPHEQSGTVNALAFSPDGKLLATGSADRSTALWDVSAGQLWATLTGPAYDVQAVAWTPDSVMLYTGAGDHTVTPWTVDPTRAAEALRHDLRQDFPAGTHDSCQAVR